MMIANDVPLSDSLPWEASAEGLRVEVRAFEGFDRSGIDLLFVADDEALSELGRSSLDTALPAMKRLLRRGNPRSLVAATRVAFGGECRSNGFSLILPVTSLSRIFDWHDALIAVCPETLIRWHRAGRRLFRRYKSRLARPPIALELRQLIRRDAGGPRFAAERQSERDERAITHRSRHSDVFTGQATRLPRNRSESGKAPACCPWSSAPR